MPNPIDPILDEGQSVHLRRTPRVGDILQHQVTTGGQAESGIPRQEAQTTGGHGRSGTQRIVGAHFAGALVCELVAITQRQAAQGATGQLHMPTQVHQRTIEVVCECLAGGVNRRADPQVQITATRQLHTAIGRDPAGAADCQYQALAAATDVQGC